MSGGRRRSATASPRRRAPRARTFCGHCPSGEPLQFLLVLRQSHGFLVRIARTSRSFLASPTRRSPCGSRVKCYVNSTGPLPETLPWSRYSKIHSPNTQIRPEPRPRVSSSWSPVRSRPARAPAPPSRPRDPPRRRAVGGLSGRSDEAPSRKRLRCASAPQAHPAPRPPRRPQAPVHGTASGARRETDGAGEGGANDEEVLGGDLGGEEDGEGAMSGATPLSRLKDGPVYVPPRASSPESLSCLGCRRTATSLAVCSGDCWITVASPLRAAGIHPAS